MIDLSLIGIATAVFAVGLILSKTSFIALARHTLALLNVMLGKYEDEMLQQKHLIAGVVNLIKGLFIFLFIVLAALVVSIGLYEGMLYIFGYEAVNISSWPAIGGFLVGGTLPFIIYGYVSPEKEDYSDWSMLIHRMVLDNQSVARWLFGVEKRMYKVTGQGSEEFLHVTGLARAGTTALTHTLFSSGEYYALAYANMPFLLNPRTWRKFNSGSGEAKERAHGDQVLISETSVEALEEFFFKVQLNDGFIDDQFVHEHEISPDVYENYLKYLELINKDQSSKHYLAKNNNLLARYESLRSYNKKFWVILLFRDPIEHAYSLMKQHQRFVEQQEKDAFTLEYMNWLAHHEFGLNQKPFKFKTGKVVEDGDRNSLTYWVQLWINYYTRALEIMEAMPNDERLLLVQYEDFLNDPQKTMELLRSKLPYKLNVELKRIDKKTSQRPDVDASVLAQAHEILGRLTALKESI